MLPKLKELFCFSFFLLLTLLQLSPHFPPSAPLHTTPNTPLASTTLSSVSMGYTRTHICSLANLFQSPLPRTLLSEVRQSSNLFFYVTSPTPETKHDTKHGPTSHTTTFLPQSSTRCISLSTGMTREKIARRQGQVSHHLPEVGP